jgi:hypothetical protein
MLANNSRTSPFGFPTWSGVPLKTQRRAASATRSESTPARIEKLVEEFSRHTARRGEISREISRLIRMGPFRNSARDFERNLAALRAGEISVNEVWPSIDQLAAVTQKPRPSPTRKPLSLQNECEARRVGQK